ncbi:MAG: hypothetical protein B6245_11450 [Desulfobacteraceae bacterium 4572_88]|nr:MAG: hypothetical protein B6245_11450 [Desulfobacteraceae bacterium 4572_88]RLC02352.1 MAG: hypothetical protein DRI57_30140 [Deltaproteobacteria bacterium]
MTRIFQDLFCKSNKLFLLLIGGKLGYLKRKYPGLHVSAGRLLNKGFKDPRLHRQDIPWESEPFISDCTFDQAEFQEKMAELSVTRLERDLLPYGDHRVKNVSMFKTSVYFPFGYVTTGRVWWTASFRQPSEKSFMPSDKCSRPCDDMTFELRNELFFLKSSRMVIPFFICIPCQC